MLCISPRGRFTVEVRQPTTTHTVPDEVFGKWMSEVFAKWMNKRFGSPRELNIRAMLKALLKGQTDCAGNGLSELSGLFCYGGESGIEHLRPLTGL